MKRNNYTYEAYNAVLTLQKLCRFRSAASELNLSASALSRLIGRLETELNVRLFDRDTRNVSITQQGRAFLRMGEQINNVSQQAIHEFEAFLASSSGQLTIAGLPSVTAGFLPSLLAQFSKSYPNIDVKIRDALSMDVVNNVSQGEADLGFTAGIISTQGKVSFLPLLEDEFVACGAMNGVLSDNRKYYLQEIISHPFIAMAAGTSVREIVDAACTQKNITFEPRFEVSHLTTAGALVSQGLGVSILPTMTLSVLGTRNIIYRKISNFGLKRRIGIIWKSGTSLSPSASEFLKIVRCANLKS